MQTPTLPALDAAPRGDRAAVEKAIDKALGAMSPGLGRTRPEPTMMRTVMVLDDPGERTASARISGSSSERRGLLGYKAAGGSAMRLLLLLYYRRRLRCLRFKMGAGRRRSVSLTSRDG